jgi:hypothetical protein
LVIGLQKCARYVGNPLIWFNIQIIISLNSRVNSSANPAKVGRGGWKSRIYLKAESIIRPFVISLSPPLCDRGFAAVAKGSEAGHRWDIRWDGFRRIREKPPSWIAGICATCITSVGYGCVPMQIFLGLTGVTHDNCLIIRQWASCEIKQTHPSLRPTAVGCIHSRCAIGRSLGVVSTFGRKRSV